MGVYINMEKPKDSCWECKAQYHSVCSLKREYIKFDGILDDCPLIDIVTCRECRHYYDGLCEHPVADGTLGTDPTDFCSYGERIDEYEKEYRELGLYELRELRKGERRADEHNT